MHSKIKIRKFNKLSLGKLWKNYNLGIVLALLFILSWACQFIFQCIEFFNQQVSLGKPFSFIEFIPAFLSATFENWQSEFLQLLSIVILTTYFVYKGSRESKDSEEKMEEILKEINNKIDLLINKP